MKTIISAGLCAICLYSCSGVPRKQTVTLDTLITEPAHGYIAPPTSFFDKLQRSFYKPDSLPKDISLVKRFTQREIAELKLDTSKVTADEYYIMTDERFLKEDMPGMKFRIYYHAYYGNFLEKVLRIETPDTVRDLPLARVVSNGNDADLLYTRFMFDSTLVQSHVAYRNTSDESNLVVDLIDSVVMVYKIDNSFNYHLHSRDTFVYEMRKTYDKGLPQERLVHAKGKPFRINGLTVYWEVTKSFPGQENGFSTFGDVYMTLIDSDRNKAILSDTDNTPSIFADFSGDGEFKDINFDGYPDYSSHCYGCSGTGGDFYLVYLYDTRSKSFKYSKRLSGGLLLLDSQKRTITYYWKMGAGWNNKFIRYFDGKGNEKYAESITREAIDQRRKSIMVKTYKKLINDKVVKIQRDTSDYTSYEDEEM